MEPTAFIRLNVATISAAFLPVTPPGYRFALVWFMSTPRIRAAGVVVSLAMLLSLVLMNYHFVGDVIAGGFLGGIIAA
jgi:hypothetical protein